MHVSLDSALGRQRRLNSVGESVLQIAPNAAAAYSLRSLTGGDPTVVRVRRGSDNHEQDFTASQVSAGALTSFVNAPVIAPLDIQALEADGRTGDFLIAKAAYSLRSLGTRQATLAATGDTVARADGKFVAQVRRNVNGDVKSFTADEVTDGTLTSFVNESFTSSLPLDVAGSAAAAYGLRNLSSSYTGNVVEVRRSSDDTTQNFTAAEVTDGTLLAFVGTGGSDNGFVKTWYDQSGNSNNATQATAASQPKIVDGGVLESDGIHFDGTDDALSATVLSSMANGAVFYLFKSQSTSENQLFEFNNGSVYGISATINSDSDGRLVASADASNDSRNGPVFGATGVTTNQKHLLSLILDSNTEITTATIDGSSMSSGASPTGRFNVGTSRMSIGQRGDNNFSEENSVSEVIIYDTDQLDKRRAIEESIATANGITLGSFSRDGFVKTWYDQSVTNEAGDTATGNHATQATAASQPKIVEGGTLLTLSGKPTIKPDGTDDFLINQSSIWDTITNTALSCMTVAGMTSSVNKQLWAIGSSTGNDGDWLIGADSSAGDVKWRGARINSNPVSIATSGTVLLTALDVTGGDAFINGASMGVLSTSSPSTTADRLVLFARRAGDSFTNQAISEAIFYDTDQTDNRTAIEANIGEAYSIDLPSGVDPGFDQVDGFVETWYDQSGNGRDATQATADNQPKIVSAGSLVSGGIEFDGSNDKLDASYSSSGTTNAYLLTAVATIANSTGNQTILATGSGSWGGDDAWLFKRRSGLNNELAIETSNGGGVLSPANYTSLESLVVAQGDSTDTKLFSNGSEVATGSVITIETQNIQIANRANSSILSGKINEIIVYFTDQSANRTALETNIASEYGITLS